MLLLIGFIIKSSRKAAIELFMERFMSRVSLTSGVNRETKLNLIVIVTFSVEGIKDFIYE